MSSKLMPGEFDCYAAALPDEPMFILLARDPSAPEMLRAWARRRRDDIFKAHDGPVPDDAKEDLRKATQAEAIADDMTVWRRDNLGRWRGGEERRAERAAPDELAMEAMRQGAIRAIATTLEIPSMWHQSKLHVSYHDCRAWASPEFPHMVHSMMIDGEGVANLREGLPVNIDPASFAIPGLIIADCDCYMVEQGASLVVHAVYND